MRVCSRDCKNASYQMAAKQRDFLFIWLSMMMMMRKWKPIDAFVKKVKQSNNDPFCMCVNLYAHKTHVSCSVNIHIHDKFDGGIKKSVGDLMGKGCFCSNDIVQHQKNRQMYSHLCEMDSNYKALALVNHTLFSFSLSHVLFGVYVKRKTRPKCSPCNDCCPAGILV